MEEYRNIMKEEFAILLDNYKNGKLNFDKKQ